MNCYLHADKPALHSLNVPCAPGGKIWVCADCQSDPQVLEKVWERYQHEHAKRIDLFKTPGNPGN